MINKIALLTAGFLTINTVAFADTAALKSVSDQGSCGTVIETDLHGSGCACQNCHEYLDKIDGR
jgi:hypothetical protein